MATSTLRVAATTMATPTPHPCALLALLTHTTAAHRRLAPPLSGRRLARRERLSARGRASIVGNTASLAASSDEGEGREEREGGRKGASGGIKVWGLRKGREERGRWEPSLYLD
jgi:hypothetical protein